MDRKINKNKNQIKHRKKGSSHLLRGISKIMGIIMEVSNQMDSKIVVEVVFKEVKQMEIIFKNYQEFKIIFSRNINNKNYMMIMEQKELHQTV